MSTDARAEYRRIAVFGGVYNNSLPLQAMLEDARRRDVEAVFCLGDMGGFGPHPNRLPESASEAFAGEPARSLEFVRGRWARM